MPIRIGCMSDFGCMQQAQRKKERNHEIRCHTSCAWMTLSSTCRLIDTRSMHWWPVRSRGRRAGMVIEWLNKWWIRESRINSLRENTYVLSLHSWCHVHKAISLLLFIVVGKSTLLDKEWIFYHTYNKHHNYLALLVGRITNHLRIQHGTITRKQLRYQKYYRKINK